MIVNLTEKKMLPHKYLQNRDKKKYQFVKG